MIKFLRHLFTPHQGNNHRAKLLHNSSLSFLVVLLLFLGFSFSFLAHSRPDILGTSYSITESEMLVRINAIRQQNNLPPLSPNQKLAAAAQGKAVDMFSKNYWAHFAPDGTTSPWSFIKNSGYNYLYAGENLAKGFSNSGDVVDAWMKSPTHRDNILSNKFKDIGFAITQGKLLGEDTVLVVEMFGSLDYPAYAASTPQNITDTSKIVKEEQPLIAAPTPKIETVKQVAQNTNLLGREEKKSAVIRSGNISLQPTFDAKTSAKVISLIILTIILAAFSFDFIITKQKKLPRLVGHNLDHIMIILIFILFVLIQKAGGIV